MIDLYYWPTPNGHKITMMLEECGLEYNLITLDLMAGEQRSGEFLAISPNGKMPAIVDHAPLAGGAPLQIFESGAILVYLAEKSRKFLSEDIGRRFEALQWLFWQMGGWPDGRAKCPFHALCRGEDPLCNRQVSL